MGNRGGKVQHGHSFKGKTTSTYRIWQMMRDRCNNPRSREFANYGGRGIKVCERWSRFVNFLADMGEHPPTLELDRIDNDGNYEPGNCRWATRVVNANNKRTNRLLTHNGETMTMAKWARRIGCTSGALLSRLDRSGMSVAEALDTPFGDPYETRRKNSAFFTVTHAGETLTAHQWAKRTGLGPWVIRQRIEAGWTPERALTTPSRQAARKAA